VSKQSDAPRIYASVLRIYIFILASIALCISLFARQIIGLIAPADFASAAAVVPVVLASYICYGMYLLFSVGIMLADRTSFNMLIACGAAALNLVLNLVAIPRFGMMGAAATTLVSYAALAGGMYIASQRYYRIPYAPGKALAIVGVGAGLFVLRELLLPTSGIGVVVGGIAILILYAVVLWASRLVSGAELAVLRELFRGAGGKFLLDRSSEVV
jgi:O-antigen/teichoic acid export membrane protein